MEIKITESTSWCCNNRDEVVNQVELMDLYIHHLKLLVKCFFSDAKIDIWYTNAHMSPLVRVSGAGSAKVIVTDRLHELRHQAWQDAYGSLYEDLPNAPTLKLRTPTDLRPTVRLRKAKLEVKK